VCMLRPRFPAYTTKREPAADIVVRRRWTRQWRNNAPERYELVTSPAVLDELAGGPRERIAERLALVRELPLLAIEPGIGEIVQACVRHKLMPADPAGDALHLALASYHKCDFLVTWNCRNLANANKFGHIRRVNTMLGLFVPILATPLELLGGNDESE
jgi:predicted nucleic acid-binding protein